MSEAYFWLCKQVIFHAAEDDGWLPNFCLFANDKQPYMFSTVRDTLFPITSAFTTECSTGPSGKILLRHQWKEPQMVISGCFSNDHLTSTPASENPQGAVSPQVC